jgi:hypothetical protein
MAADLLLKKRIVDINDIDRMLSDKNFSVQKVGMNAVHRAMNPLEHGILPSPTDPLLTSVGLRKYIVRKDHYRVKEQLIPILLKHLNDNHFHIRAECYRCFASLVERRRYGLNGHFAGEKPETLPAAIRWQWESWWKRREEQQKLLSWWEGNGEHVLRNYGPDWRESDGSHATTAGVGKAD